MKKYHGTESRFENDKARISSLPLYLQPFRAYVSNLFVAHNIIAILWHKLHANINFEYYNNQRCEKSSGNLLSHKFDLQT